MHTTGNPLGGKATVATSIQAYRDESKREAFWKCRIFDFPVYTHTHTCFRKQLSCLCVRLCLPAWPSSFTMSPAHPHPGDLGTSKQRQTHPFLIRFEGPNGQLLQFRSGYAVCWATEHRNKSFLNTAHSFTQLSRHHYHPASPFKNGLCEWGDHIHEWVDMFELGVCAHVLLSLSAPANSLAINQTLKPTSCRMRWNKTSTFLYIYTIYIYIM